MLLMRSSYISMIEPPCSTWPTNWHVKNLKMSAKRCANFISTSVWINSHFRQFGICKTNIGAQLACTRLRFANCLHFRVEREEKSCGRNSFLQDIGLCAAPARRIWNVGVSLAANIHWKAARVSLHWAGDLWRQLYAICTGISIWFIAQ